MTSGLVHPYHLDESFLRLGVSGGCFHFYTFFPQKCLQVNNADRVQTPLFAASELGLHNLHNTPKWVSSLKRFTGNPFFPGDP